MKILKGEIGAPLMTHGILCIGKFYTFVMPELYQSEKSLNTSIIIHKKWKMP